MANPTIIKATKTIGTGKTCKSCRKTIKTGDLILPVEFMNGVTGWRCSDCAAQVDPLVKKLLSANLELDSDQMQRVLDRASEAAKDKAGDVLADAMTRIEDIIKEEVKKAKLPRTIIIQQVSGKQTKIDDATHPQFEDIVKMIGAGLNVYMPGPAGCGKTHLAGQVARALGLDFYPMSVGGGTSESHLLGKQTHDISKGKIIWHPTPLMNAFVNGGLVLIDELDACDPNVLIILNAIAECDMTIYCQYDPNNPMKKRHENFRLMAAGNTLAHGADREYVGRFAQDAALMSRFAKMPLDYSPAVDRACCLHDQTRNHMISYRPVLREARIKTNVSSRTLKQSYALHQAGFDLATIEQTFFNEFTPTEVDRIKPKLRHLWKDYSNN